MFLIKLLDFVYKDFILYIIELYQFIINYLFKYKFSFFLILINIFISKISLNLNHKIINC